MTFLEILFLILFGISAVGNVFQAVFGLKIEYNQTQIMSTYNINANENNNLNLINDTIILSNAYMVTSFATNYTNFKIYMPAISTNYKVTQKLMSVITNQSNTTKIGLIPR